MYLTFLETDGILTIIPKENPKKMKLKSSFIFFDIN